MSITEAKQRAIEAFEAVHRQDPAGLALDYHRALVAWVGRIAPAPSLALELAACAQHLDRHRHPRSAFPQGSAGYHRWRTAAAEAQARQAGSMLNEAGFDEALVLRVQALLQKKGLRSDVEVQRFEDAICLTFLQLQFVEFARKHSKAKVIDIVQKTLRKMSDAGRKQALALAAELPEELRGWVAEASTSLASS